MKKLIIMRGLSGSGKSTYVRKHFPGAVVCSADLFFCGGDPDGEYRFNPDDLGKAHMKSRSDCEKALAKGEPLIVVDNTNSTYREMRPYIRAGERFGYDIEVIRIDCDLEVAKQRNTKGTPPDVVHRMWKRFQPYEGEKIVLNSTAVSSPPGKPSPPDGFYW